MTDPARYLTPSVARTHTDVSEGTIYTRTMHPQIRLAGQGACSICGMALEPDVITPDAPANPELADYIRRFKVGLTLPLTLLALAMGRHLLALDRRIAPQIANWLQLLLARPVVLWAGWLFFERGARSVVSSNLNMFTLISLGTGVDWAIIGVNQWGQAIQAAISVQSVIGGASDTMP